MTTKVAITTRQRLQGRNYWYSILVTKRCLELTYSTIADWMGITTSNLTSMISQHLNPYPGQWKGFKAGVKNHNICIQVWVDEARVRLCRCGCGKTFVLGSPVTRKWFSRKCRSQYTRFLRKKENEHM